MKKGFGIFLWASLPFWLMSCDKEITSGERQTAIRLSTGIEVQTRAAFPALDTQIPYGETVAVWVDRADGTQLYGKNVMTADGSGNLSGGSPMFFPLNGDNVNIYALHTNASYSGSAYPSATMTHIVRQDQRTQADYAASDLLYSMSRNVARRDDAVPMTFYHLLSKLQVAIVAVDGLDPSNIRSITVGPMKYYANLSLDKYSAPNALPLTAAGQSGSIMIGTDVSEDFSANVRYNDVIVVPQTVPAQSAFLTVTLADESALVYRLNSDVNFESGKKYSLHMTVSLKGIELSTAVSDWRPGDLITGDSDIVHYEVTYTDLTTETIYKKGMGGTLEFAGAGKTVRSIALPEFGKSYLIGRKDITSLDLNLDASGNLRFRPAEDGFVPIGSYAELQLINTLDGALSGCYKQEADIDLMSEEWTPIGDEDNPFTGVYQGADCQIEQIYITASMGYAGLFGYIQGSTAEVSELHIASGTIDGRFSWAGSVCAYLNGGIIRDCTNVAAVTTTLNPSFVGGLIGYARGGRVRHCFNNASIYSYGNAGGVVGVNGGNAEITACYNTGPIASSARYAGGIVGCNETNSNITACFNSGSVTSYESAGGIAGTNSGGSAIRACYNDASVSETSYSAYYSGGIAGENETSSSIIACYNVGMISATVGSNYRGGVAGQDYHGTIISCYWKSGPTMPSNSVGSSSGSSSSVAVSSFETVFTPDAETYPQWGLGNGEENGWWKNYNGNNGLPQLWWEEDKNY